MTLHTALNATYGSRFSAHKGMLEIDQDELAKLLGSLGLPAGHPVLDFIDFDALEDAAQGGLDGLTKLRNRRRARGVSREELARSRKGAEQVGRLGEEILNAWFEAQHQIGNGPEYRWDSDTNAVAPYDFTLMSDGNPERRVDAKSTSGDFRNPIHVSLSELIEMARVIFRMTSTGFIRLLMFPRVFVSPMTFVSLQAVSLMQSAVCLEGVAIDSVSINPDKLAFGDEIIIDLSECHDDSDDAEEPSNN
ncbi:MAG: hypothetical protein MZV65_18775 [Chromatiales bacterium]|nr:hypothetical protein [Chromatiales bacterium]